MVDLATSATTFLFKRSGVGLTILYLFRECRRPPQWSGAGRASNGAGVSESGSAVGFAGGGGLQSLAAAAGGDANPGRVALAYRWAPPVRERCEGANGNFKYSKSIASLSLNFRYYSLAWICVGKHLKN